MCAHGRSSLTAQQACTALYLLLGQEESALSTCRGHVPVVGALHPICVCTLVSAQGRHVENPSIQSEWGVDGAGLLPLQKCCGIRYALLK